jgi:hypothetical protein
LITLLQEARVAERGLTAPAEKAVALLARGKAEIAVGQTSSARITLQRGVKTLHEAKRNKNSLNHLQAETRHDDTLLLRYLAAQMDAGAVADATRTALFLAQKTLPADVQSDDTFTKEIIATMESKRKGSSEPIQRLIKTHLDKQQDDARREQQPEISAFVRESLSRARAETDSSKRASEILAIISVPGWTAALKPDEQQNLWMSVSRCHGRTQIRRAASTFCFSSVDLQSRIRSET